MKEITSEEFMKLNNKKYDVDIVRIVNLKQIGVYIQNGIKPIDIYFTDRLVFVFNKDETGELFERWKNKEFA